MNEGWAVELKAFLVKVDESNRAQTTHIRIPSQGPLIKAIAPGLLILVELQTLPVLLKAEDSAERRILTSGELTLRLGVGISPRRLPRTPA